ncbi:alpha/beta hydrolase family protein [Steroidobacter flavus]|uniref:Alpha/beta hydrolase family protein n=1 Tax=Steroidobacter flavus TaxID=1842136 RepID=A0ABV8SPZ5_9GAMM
MRTLFAVVGLIALAGCASLGARLSSKPGAYTVTVQPVHAPHRDIHATYVHPDQDRHPGYLVLFVTGDDGWFGTSRAVFAHLADEGYTLAGFSAPEAIDGVAESVRVGTARAAEGLKDVYAQAKRHLGLPDSTPIVMVGFSRGASAVAFTAVHPELRDGLKGAVAIALTREADYLHATESERKQGIQVDSEDRIQLYGALKLLGATPFAVIQSTNDSYVPAAESRQLLGADTATLRLYSVESEDHGFSDARDKLMQDLDDALHWIEEEKASAPTT